MEVLIAGGGRVATELGRRLRAAGHHPVVVSDDAGVPERLASAAPGVRVVVAPCTDPAALEAAGIRRADVVAAVTDDDASNLVVASLARFEFGVERTIARIVDPAHGWLFGTWMGIDVAVDQADLLTRLILEEISLGDVATLVKLRRGDLSLVEERLGVGSPVVGSPVGEVALPDGCVLLGVVRGDQVLVPRADLRFEVDDEVLAIVHGRDADALTRLLTPPETRRR